MGTAVAVAVQLISLEFGGSHAVHPGTECCRSPLTGSASCRHMMGTAVAVATQRMSLQFAEATLCIPARTALPLAPGAPLVLAENAFLHFPR